MRRWNYEEVSSSFNWWCFVVSASSVFAVESCVKCHKSMDKVAEVIKKSGAKSADELVDFLRNKSAKRPFTNL